MEGKTSVSDKHLPNTRNVSVTPGYFATLNTPLLAGRNFTDSDRPGAPAVAIVNQSFVKRYYPNSDAIGRRIRLGSPKNEQSLLTIVGVSGNQFTGDQNDPL